TDEVQAGVNFGVPVSEFDFLDLGFRIEHTQFTPGQIASKEVLEFDQSVGGDFIALLATASYARDTRNKRVLPNAGSVTRLSGEIALPGGDITYYKTELYHQQFVSLLDEFTLILEGEIGYGHGYGDTEKLPLTDNFFAGGIRSVRGFKSNTLGPRDSRNEPFGGNFKMVGSAEVVLPVPFLQDIKQFRLTGFFDVGSVFGDNQDFDVGDLRYSAGLGAIYLSPLGALTFSWGVPLKTKSGDETEPFQFTFGTSF
ncbi:MAG: BamA/TamA family outer membrane protein, partial [Chromatiales bacterium]|nr:BamA/TamA family outer membrane protein [Chromatiales bacterium]